MKRWAQVLQATVQFVSEMIGSEWRSLGEWQANTAVSRMLFVQVSQWVEAFTGQPLLQAFEQHRPQQLLLAKQVREELFVLLSDVEPLQAMVLLCSLPIANDMGYRQDRLTLLLQMESSHVQEVEQQAFARLRECVSSRTPFLHFLAQRVAELGVSGVVDRQQEGAEKTGNAELQQAVSANELFSSPAESREEQTARLLREVWQNPHFDLRVHMTSALELAIRQALHANGIETMERVQALFAKEEYLAVQLVAERMKLEMSGGREERADGGSR